MTQVMRRWSLILFFFTYVSVSLAHNENELTYVIENEILTIHLTPKTAVDLLIHNGEISPEQGSVDLTVHYESIARYFAEHIEIEMSGNLVNLKFLDANFNSHDATVNFRLLNMPEHPDHLEITMKCLLDVYNRPLNTVLWKVNSETHECRLDRENQFCFIELGKDARSILNTSNFVIAFVILLVLILVILFIIKN